MLYKFKFLQEDPEETPEEKVFYVQSPENINHDIAINVCRNDSQYSLIDKLADNDLPEKSNHTKLEDFISPSLFIDRTDDGDMIPDISNMKYVDRDFMEEMFYLWSKSNNSNGFIMLIDEMEDKLDFLIENKNNDKYKDETKSYGLSIAGFSVTGNKNKKDCDCSKLPEDVDLEKLTEEVLKSYGKIKLKPKDVYFRTRTDNENNIIVEMTDKEYYEERKHFSYFDMKDLVEEIPRDWYEKCPGTFVFANDYTEDEVKQELLELGFLPVPI